MREAFFDSFIKGAEDFIGLTVADMKTKKFAIFCGREGLQRSLKSFNDRPDGGMGRCAGERIAASSTFFCLYNAFFPESL